MHLYIHIPFCKQACHYCDFHFSTNLKQKTALVDALCREIDLQKDYLPTRRLETIYLGGGTPSLLTETELEILFETIHRQYTVAPDAEITLEANPDDLIGPVSDPLRQLRLFRKYVNRLSIGIQSFHEPHLRLMNRAHSATEAGSCVQLAQEAGFTNLTIDLIYGVPADTHGIWQTDLAKAVSLKVPHISAYCLTIEPGTVFGNWHKKGRLQAAEDEFAAEQFTMLVQTLRENGYEQYEISNFAQPGCEARHNSSYWKRRPYLGIGPSAHSFNGVSRQYNIAHNIQYIRAIEKGDVPGTVEPLSRADQVNDYLLTGLRTKWGCDLRELSRLAGSDFQVLQRTELQNLYQQGWLSLENHLLTLTEAGKLFADRVAAELFMVESDEE
ncbi:oxygen-independent coproporphyrinogen-3 oxidase [Larkinella arboricola]|uniref:Heme chaperone HemW n=1 Tax=Larkinella arboricola TaxID=643671 RepID=A0A327WUX3_LARAB|nr:radical SAM family heme chaperone HemW [Larkinella arboricola]RAJ95476.1 oxygen-independent coproporphyrinogen-3 oxidase [Larkinella arboricola]